MYTETELVLVGKRENNKKRNYLVINPLQGKHIPVRPGKATAIGAQAAIRSGAGYIHTTREVILQEDYIYFSEAHSHAAEQKLVRGDMDRAVETADRIIFIEDEVTTGNTILNIVGKMEERYGRKMQFSVASILNGMTREHMRIYEEKGIPCHYILKTNHQDYGRIAQQYRENGCYEKCDISACHEVDELRVTGWMDARRMTDSRAYLKSCEALWKSVEKAFHFVEGERVLVVGTEEFMYPALFAGACLEDCGNHVVCHSTTRSPIAVSSQSSYPLHIRYELESFYQKDRRTFIYDLKKYDRVIMITDAKAHLTEGAASLVCALRSCGNENIQLFWWGENR